MYLVVIDGRSTASSGVSLAEAGGVFLGLGAVNAVNLDGGGSSCMVVNGEVVNTPSDGTLRPVGNGCLLISNAPALDSIGLLNFEPRSWNISISAKMSPKVWGYNKYGVLKIRDLQGCTFSCDEQVGHFTSDGTFIAAAKPAQGNLYASYGGITASQPINVVNAEKRLAHDSVVVDNAHSYEIKVLGMSGLGSDIVDPSIISWASSDSQVASVSSEGIVNAVANGRATVWGTGDNFDDTLTVRVENPKARITTIENAPIDPSTWTVAQSGGRNRTVSALDNGLKIEFTGASSRNPYIRLTKRLQLWGIPDTLRVRFNPGGLQVKRINISTANPGGTQVISQWEDLPDTIAGDYTVDLPTAQWCDAANLSNYPLRFVYLNFATASPVAGQHYTFSIPGIELIYGSAPSAITAIGSDDCSPVVSEAWYDLTGREVARPGKGIYLHRVRLASGATRTTKVLK